MRRNIIQAVAILTLFTATMLPRVTLANEGVIHWEDVTQITDNPDGGLKHPQLKELACNVMAQATLDSDGNVGSVAGGVTAEINGYRYAFYLHELLEYCRVYDGAI